MTTEHRMETLAPRADPAPEVALLIHHLDRGGAERVQAILAAGLAERGISVDLVLAKRRGNYLADVPARVRVVDLGVSRMTWSLAAIAKYLRRVRPLVMISALDHVNVSALLARRISFARTRLIICQHSVTSMIAQTDTSWRHRTMRYLMRSCYHWADEIVAVSSGVADMVVEMTGVPRDRIHVIYNPVLTPDLFRRADQPLEHPWFEAGSPPVILAIGSLSPWKDHATLIRAVVHARTRKAVRLMILGEGVERHRLETLIQTLKANDCVALCGFVANPYPYLRRAKALVLSSRWESFSNVLVEALALHVAVISTDCDYGPREILNGGRYGILVPVGNASAMADAILAVLARERQVVPGQYLRQFTLESSVDHYLRLLRRPDRSVPESVGTET